MNKILRISMIAVLALIANFSFGQDAIFTETFDKCAGKGGNDGIWTNISGNKALSDDYTDNAGWVGTKATAGSKCAIIGASKAAGKIISPSISGIKGDATLKIKVGAWKGDGTKIKLSTSNGTLEAKTATISNEKFAEITLYITNITADFKITFEANVASRNRFFLDEVKVYKGKLPKPEITYTDVPSVKDLLTNYTKATTNLNLKLTNAKVLYVNNYNGTVNTYVREGDAAIELRTLGFDMPANSTISGTVKVDLDYSYGVPYIKANDATNDESLTIQESTEEAQPVVATVADIIAKKYINDLVIIKDVKFTKESVTSGTSTRTNYYINDGDKKVQLYDKFQVSDLATLTDGETYTVQGLFGQIFKDVPEILMTKKVAETTGINNITTDATLENAPAFNLAGQKVGKAYKGVVIKAGKKFVQK